VELASHRISFFKKLKL